MQIFQNQEHGLLRCERSNDRDENIKHFLPLALGRYVQRRISLLRNREGQDGSEQRCRFLERQMILTQGVFERFQLRLMCHILLPLEPMLNHPNKRV